MTRWKISHLHPEFLCILPEIDISTAIKKGDIIVRTNTHRKERRTARAETTKKVEHITQPDSIYLFDCHGYRIIDCQSSNIRTSLGTAAEQRRKANTASSD